MSFANAFDSHTRPVKMRNAVNARAISRWATNAFAKLIDTGFYDWHYFSFSLIDRQAARAVAADASVRTQIKPLGAVYRDLILTNWGFFQYFLSVVELAIGLGLILGIATRLAAVGGILLLFPIWMMLWHAGGYLWEYPAEDLFPLLLLAMVPAGRVFGFDRGLAVRFHGRWPF